MACLDTHKILGGDILAVEKKLIQVEPIPLTEEWLVRLGIETCKNSSYHYEPFSGIYWSKKDLKCDIDSEYQIEVPDFVHQLQNLYFALTGQELSTNKNNI